MFALLLQSFSYFSIWGAFKLNQTFIAENICINRFDAIPICFGSCYLEDQFNSSNQQDESSPDFSQASVSLMFEQFQSISFEKIEMSTVIDFPLYNSSFDLMGYNEDVFHPPIV